MGGAASPSTVGVWLFLSADRSFCQDSLAGRGEVFVVLEDSLKK